jgi:hypothetical protein
MGGVKHRGVTTSAAKFKNHTIRNLKIIKKQQKLSKGLEVDM